MTTQSVCWWCCHPPPRVALHMPCSYNSRDQSFTTKGAYCSWECMKAHNHAQGTEFKISTVNSYILLMRKQVYGKCMPGGKASKKAQHFSNLKMFGGSMSIEEFRSGNHPDEGEAKPPVVGKTQYSEILSGLRPHQETPSADGAHKMWEINNSTSTNEPLRLKRQIPLKREQNNLAAMLGLRKKGV